MNSPYGQFISQILRGSESRNNLVAHCAGLFKELDEIVRNGINILIFDSTVEKFNVIVFLVADLGFIKEICGKCTTTSTYGCYRCKKKVE